MPVITISVGTKIALGVIAVIALGAGGLSIAAAADTLPDPIITESPAPTDDPIDDDADDDESDDESDEGEDGEDSDGSRGPDANGPAGYGLCTAYLAGGLRTVSTAYDSLSTAAGEDGVDAFCEVVIADKKGLSDEDSDDSDEKSGVSKGKAGATEHGKPADKPVKEDKPEKPSTSDKGNKGGNGGGNGGSSNGNGHNKH